MHGLPMTMQDWVTQLDLILRANRYDILNHPGRMQDAPIPLQAPGSAPSTHIQTWQCRGGTPRPPKFHGNAEGEFSSPRDQ